MDYVFDGAACALEAQAATLPPVEAAECSPDAGAIETGAAAGRAEKFGKFADAKQLLKAYESLEKEFTRKCQKVKELENSVPRQSCAETAAAGGDSRYAPETPPDGPAAPCYMREDWTRTVDNFVRQNPGAREFADEIAAFIVNDPVTAAATDALEKAYFNILKEKYVAPEKFAANEAYLEKYVFNSEPIKRRIIADYLTQLQKMSVPAVICGESGTFSLTPPNRPKTIKEASVLAEKYFTNNTKK